MSSVSYSKDNPEDSSVKNLLASSHHNEIMEEINQIAPNYEELAQKFCIPQSKIENISYDNRHNKAWHALNAVVTEWLKGNTSVYDEGVKANVRWLYDAVRTINNDLGTKIAKKYGIQEQNSSTTDSDTGAMCGNQGQGTDGIEEPDSGPPDVKKYCPELANKIQNEPFTNDLVKDINIVLVTATDVEYHAVMGQATPIKGDKYMQTRSERITFNIAMYGKYKVAIIRTGQGTDNTSKELQKIQKVVKAQYVIAVGICYGMKEGKKKTKFGTILVAQRVKKISIAKYKDGGNELKTEDYRSGETLYDIFKSYQGFALDNGIDYNVNVLTGEDILVTESSLNTSQQHKDEIQGQVPQALGGEMEAAVILGKPDEFEGIVIKSIADWGDMNKASCAPWKEFSTYAAAKYVWYQLSNIPEDELKRKP